MHANRTRHAPEQYGDVRTMAGNHLTPRAFLAREIRLAREAKGMSAAALGKAVFVSESLVRAWESGRYIPKPDQIDDLEKALGTNGILARMAEDLVNNEAVPEFMGKWLTVERGARILLTYQPMLIPGLLQTEDYAREVIVKSGRLVNDISERVQARMDRQEILTVENDVTFVVIVDEGALNRAVVSPKVMYEQLVHIHEVAQQPNVHFFVVPDTVGAYPGCAGGFIIATIDGREVVYVDDAFSGDILESEEDVTTMKRVWESIRLEAVSGQQSRELLEKAIEKWEKRT
jgi:transcriptional regulator with XRE-family HTH domain